MNSHCFQCFRLRITQYDPSDLFMFVMCGTLFRISWHPITRSIVDCVGHPQCSCLDSDIRFSTIFHPSSRFDLQMILTWFKLPLATAKALGTGYATHQPSPACGMLANSGADNLRA